MVTSKTKTKKLIIDLLVASKSNISARVPDASKRTHDLKI